MGGLFQPQREEISISVVCEKAMNDKKWTARAELRASSLTSPVTGVSQGDSRRKAAQAATDVAYEAYDAKRPKPFRKKAAGGAQ
jgi:hypothetical protein